MGGKKIGQARLINKRETYSVRLKNGVREIATLVVSSNIL